ALVAGRQENQQRKYRGQNKPAVGHHAFRPHSLQSYPNASLRATFESGRLPKGCNLAQAPLVGARLCRRPAAVRGKNNMRRLVSVVWELTELLRLAFSTAALRCVCQVALCRKGASRDCPEPGGFRSAVSDLARFSRIPLYGRVGP